MTDFVVIPGLPQHGRPLQWTDRTRRMTASQRSQRADGSRSITIIVNVPGSTGPRRRLPSAGAGPNFAETTNTR